MARLGRLHLNSAGFCAIRTQAINQLINQLIDRLINQSIKVSQIPKHLLFPRYFWYLRIILKFLSTYYE